MVMEENQQQQQQQDAAATAIQKVYRAHLGRAQHLQQEALTFTGFDGHGPVSRSDWPTQNQQRRWRVVPASTDFHQAREKQRSRQQEEKESHVGLDESLRSDDSLNPAGSSKGLEDSLQLDDSLKPPAQNREELLPHRQDALPPAHRSQSVQITSEQLATVMAVPAHFQEQWNQRFKRVVRLMQNVNVRTRQAKPKQPQQQAQAQGQGQGQAQSSEAELLRASRVLQPAFPGEPLPPPTASHTQQAKSCEELFQQFKSATDMPAICSSFLAMFAAAVREAGSAPAPTGLGVFHLLKKRAARKQYINKRWWKMLEARLAVTWYARAPLKGLKVVVVGSGPGGLRTAVEAALLGAHVVVLEKRHAFSRNNILHIWDTSIVDLKALGAQFFDAKFGVLQINHYSIRELQCLLLRVCLVLGVHFLPGAEYCGLVPPASQPTAAAAPDAPLRAGWFVQTRLRHRHSADGSQLPTEHVYTSAMHGAYNALYSYQAELHAKAHPVHTKNTHPGESGPLPPYNPSLLYLPANVLIGADGANAKVPRDAEFEAQFFKGSGEAIGLTANFVNAHTKEEQVIPEFTCSQVYAPEFFERLRKQHSLELENLVYFHGTYTHYIVTCPKLSSLLERKVVKEKRKGVDACLENDNLDYEALSTVVRDVARELGVPDSAKFAQVRGRNDCALFNFANKVSHKTAARVLKGTSEGKAQDTVEDRLLVCLVGDALQEPFWPLGTGANRALLSALDTAWLLSAYGLYLHKVGQAGHEAEEKELLAQREITHEAMKTCLPDTLRELSTREAVSDMDPALRYPAKSLHKRKPAHHRKASV
eukprot:g37523.t1